MKQLTLEYTVIELGMMGSLVEMKLKAPIQMPMISAPVEDVPSEEDVRKMLEKIKPAKAGGRNMDREMVNDLVTAYVDAFKEKMPEMFEGIKGYGGGGYVSSVAPLFDAVLYLTPEQYEAMGSPPLLSKLRLRVGMVK